MFGSQTWLEANAEEYADFLNDATEDPSLLDAGEGDIDSDFGFDPYAGGPETDEPFDPYDGGDF